MECTIGGTRRHLRDLAHGLQQRGHTVEVACAALREPRMREDMAAMEAAGIRVHEIPMVRPIRPGKDAWHALRLAGCLADRRFDVVHTHSSKAGALGRSVSFLCSSAARIHTPHTYAASFEGGAGQGGELPGPLGLIMTTERLLGRVTQRLIHVSEGERDEGQMLGVVAPDRARVVPNGIDPAPFSSPAGGDALRAELGIPADARVVGSVGLLNDAKGHDLLLDAAARLPDDVHLLIVGHGELEGALKGQAAELGLSRRLHLAGWRDDLPACHDAMDAFVLSSRWEGLSYALLEAVAAGLPAVSTDVNGSRDVLDPGEGQAPCGLVVPTEDVPALAEALEILLTDRERAAAFAEAGPARVAERFTVDAMVDATVAVYEEVLGRREAAA
jgi:glycosyltransferase involved in cell wall biosynthesis